MIAKQLKNRYRKRRNIAAGIAVVSMLVLILRQAAGYQNGDQWYINVLAFAYIISFIAACWFYLKSKQRSGGWLLLLPANIIAIIVYVCLEDRSGEPDNIQCPACQAFNFPSDLTCRFCKTTMPRPIADQEALS